MDLTNDAPEISEELEDDDPFAFWELSDEEIIELRDFLQTRCVPNGGTNLAMFDGLLTARITADEYNTSPPWWPLVYGMSEEEAKTRLFTSPEEAKHFDALIWNRFDQIYQALKSGTFPVTYLRASTIESDCDPSTYADLWCVGYLRDVVARPHEWRSLLRAAEGSSHTGAFEEAVGLLGPYITGSFEARSAEECRRNTLWAQIVETLPVVSQEIYTRWDAYKDKNVPTLSVVEERLPLRVPPKPGRNEPCPCSSGKKYKKCCGVA